MTTLEQNLRALAEQSPAVTQALRELEPDRDMVIEPARSGLPTASRGGTYLHSRHDPRREAYRIVERLAQKHKDCVIVYGFGLGYLAEECLRHTDAETVVVCEANAAAVASALRARDMRFLLSHPRLRIMIGPSGKELSSLLTSLNCRAPLSVGLTAVTARETDYYRHLERARRSFATRAEVNSNTLKRFGRRWIRNLATNAFLVADARGVAELEGAFAHAPALVCAGGPSLDDFFFHARRVARRAVVIAVDTAVKPLLRHGVEPDFVVVVDPQYWNTRHLDNLSLSHALVVGESSTNPRAFRVLRRPTFLCSSIFPLGSYLESGRSPLGRLGTGGSVTTTAWDFARHLGCAEIFVSGLDLGYPAYRTHVGGSLFEERSHILSNRTVPAETSHTAYIHGGNPFWTASTDGTQVLTDQRMAIYREWFSLQEEMASGTRTYNLSAHGVHIESHVPASIEDIASKAPCREEIERTHRAYRRAAAEGAGEAPAVSAMMSKLEAELERIEQITVRAIAAVEQLRRTGGGEDLIEQFERELTAAAAKDIVGFLVEEVAGELRKAAPSSLDEALENSRRLYESIVESARFHKDAVSRARTALRRGASGS